MLRNDIDIPKAMAAVVCHAPHDYRRGRSDSLRLLRRARERDLRATAPVRLDLLELLGDTEGPAGAVLVERLTRASATWPSFIC